MVQALPILRDVLPAQYALPVSQAVYFVVTFLVIVFVGRVVVRPLVNRVLNRRALDVHARRPLLKMTTAVVYFVAVAASFGFAGFSGFLQSLATIAAAGTLAIGFALQDVIKNFVAGVFIYTDRPFKIGDWIEWDGNSGIVEDISLRVTRVRTFDNELLTVPNSTLTDDVLKNPVANERLRLQFMFGISYDDDIDTATDIIIEEGEAHEGIMNEPGVTVRLAELGDSYVGLKSRFWIDDPSRSDFVKIRSEYIQTVKERFDEEGIDIPYPVRTLDGEVEIAGSPTVEHLES
ncbi:mechanosensitive ion channel family protein [Halanaeroarchaeum sulfurireducens]|uniref:Mechanosensitive ion channel protein n=1 Tax=Halanaeroarchaeum sulfurireducens TaxID=1604004 RepID=A0A0F7PEK1_9EURY|nr:mechanosensitive ion channel family protein [Halanaeroarchaeum sulfurireducens]AKH97738.1 mechanosensitive ion channel protein [Halanaeroarchaeum sulfurireducens]ALG82133.1 mechanosensitive ion channel protein [Halanaeroarchaeum sulfurireducens]